MKKRVIDFFSGLLIGVVASLLIVYGYYVFGPKPAEQRASTIEDLLPALTDKDSDELLNKEAQSKIQTLAETIKLFYMDEVDDETLRNGMYYGMLDSLGDPYSTYYTREEYQSMMEQSEGIYFGIGAYVSIDTETNYPKISGLIKNTPAEASGLQENDIIYKIGEEDVFNQDLSEVVSKIKGEEGTFVHLTIVREGENDSLEFDVERKKIESPTVESEMKEGNIGYIQITEFDTVTETQFNEALDSMIAADVKGLVLDLRSNPGGNLSTVVAICKRLLPPGLIVYTEDKYGKKTEYKCDGTSEWKKPLVVLVNGNSASASEILAGAIKDYQIGTLLGTTTFGKGIVQKLYNYNDGSAVKITVSKYFTPNGTNIHKTGIEPDEVLEWDAEAYKEDKTDNQLERALEIIREK